MINDKYLKPLLVVMLFITANCFAQRPVKKSHYLDKFPIMIETWDSSAHVFRDSLVRSDWRIFYDTQLTHLMADLYVVGDTLYCINYYRNGNKKSDMRFIDLLEVRYHAEWCENGQLKIERKNFFDRLQTFTVYYCSGRKYQEFDIYRGAESWGTARCWYENGQLAWEVVYPEFDYATYHSGLLKHERISESFWDSTGVRTKTNVYK